MEQAEPPRNLCSVGVNSWLPRLREAETALDLVSTLDLVSGLGYQRKDESVIVLDYYRLPSSSQLVPIALSTTPCWLEVWFSWLH